MLCDTSLIGRTIAFCEGVKKNKQHNLDPTVPLPSVVTEDLDLDGDSEVTPVDGECDPSDGEVDERTESDCVSG